jgi:hypothetical protein
MSKRSVYDTLHLPAHYNTEIVEIAPRNTGNGFEPASALCSLLDELKAELDEAPFDGGLYHNRASIIEAYGENRMYGIYAPWSESMVEHDSLEDPIFVTKKHHMIHCMLPCFLVLEKEWDGEHSVCTFLWTAKRARNKGMANNLLEFFEVRKTHLPLPEAEAFWSNYFARLKDEIKENTTD